MRPITLKLKGINSFYEEQEISFEKLIQHGLFGITGDTGSGKSTILDALTLSLYGQSTRDRFINTSSEKAFVSFEFEINGLRYIAERGYKRKKEGGYLCSHARLLHVEQGEKKLVAENARSMTTAVENVLGLGYDDFTRSVVLPQGKFSEFLSLTPSNRSMMLERILGLERVGSGLKDRINKRLAKHREEQISLESKLSLYEGITPESIEQIKQQLIQTEAEKAQAKNSLAEKEKEYSKLKNLYDIQVECEASIKKRKLLEADKSSYQKIEKSILLSTKVETIYDGYTSYKQMKSQLEVAKGELSAIEKSAASNSILLKASEASHEEAKHKFENIKPQLAEKKVKVLEAIKIIEDAEPVLNEMKQLRAQHVTKSKQIKKHTETLEQYENNMQLQSDLLKKLTTEKDEIQTLLKDSEAIFLAYETETKYKALSQAKSSVELKLKNAAKQAEKYSTSLSTAQQKHMECEELLKEALSEKESLVKPDENDIIVKNSELSVLISKIKKVTENENKLSILNSDIKKNEEKIIQLKKDIDNIKIESIKAELDKEISNKKIIEDSNIAYILAQNLKEDLPCPVCGSTSHPSPAQQIVGQAVNEIEANIKQLEKQIASAEKKLNKAQQELHGLEMYNSARINEYKELEAERIAETDKPLHILKDDERSINEQITQLQKAMEHYRAKSVDNDKKVDKLKAECTKLATSIAVLNESIKKTEEETARLKAELDSIAIAPIEKEFNDLIQKWQLNSFSEKQTQMLRASEKSIELAQSEVKLRNEIDKLATEIKNTTEIMRTLQTEISQITAIGAEKKLNYDAQIKKAEALAEAKEPKKFLDELTAGIKEIDTSFNVSVKSLEELKQKAAAISEQHIELKKRTEIFSQQLLEQEQRLKQKADEIGISSLELIEPSVLAPQKKKEMIASLNKYLDEIKIFDATIEGLKMKLGDFSMEPKKLDEYAAQVEEQQKKLTHMTETFATLTQKLADFEVKLAESLTLKKELLKTTKQTDLLSDLSALFSGNKFVEHISETELKYITLEASKRLKSITQGKYELSFENKDFYIIDNFNAGAKRPPSSLSGGELFLSSLALAIALSSKIQLKGTPLEFFFLDEGFGSLDSKLIDTVMTSLENLRRERLCIGIITHVEELKDRLPIKLSVKKHGYEIQSSSVIIE